MRRRAPLAIVAAVCVSCAATPPASALPNPIKPLCGVAGFFSGLAGKACRVVQNGGRVLSAGKKLLGGHVGSAIKTVVGGGGSSTAKTVVGLAAVGAWVLGGLKVALDETAAVLNSTTTPDLQSTWFSSTYWRMTGIAAVLTLPFLFAACVQALLRSDLTLLLRSALGYLPLAMLATSIAAPLTMLLLAASDQLAAIVASASGHASTGFLTRAALGLAALHSPFLAFLLGLLTIFAAIMLWTELLMREAAVYVIVLMLPLAFAAIVWPARRIWAIRAVELLVALILSKFAIVAVLSLGGAALSSSHGLHVSFTAMLAGFVLIVMGAFAPWALLRLLPLTELASSAMAGMKDNFRTPGGAAADAFRFAHGIDDWARTATAEMRHAAADGGGYEPRPALPSGGSGGDDERPGGSAVLVAGDGGGPAGPGGRRGGGGAGPAGSEVFAGGGGVEGEAREPAFEPAPDNAAAAPANPAAAQTAAAVPSAALAADGPALSAPDAPERAGDPDQQPPAAPARDLELSEPLRQPDWAWGELDLGAKGGRSFRFRQADDEGGE